MSAEITTGRGGLPKLDLVAPSGARAEVYLQGAQVTSWRTPDGIERLFVSEHSRSEPGVAVRGGVPVIFPQFSGLGPLPKHGFARTQPWQFADAGSDPSAPWVRLELPDSPELRSLWPFPFAAAVTVVLGDRLSISLSVVNRGTKAMEFTAALHTYLRVGDAGEAEVEGLAGLHYLDASRNGAEEQQDDAPLAIRGPVNRIYQDVPPVLTLRDGQRTTFRIETEGFRDAVLWNPWAEGARELADLGETEYREMVCLEPANAPRPVRLAPGERWSGTQHLSTGER